VANSSEGFVGRWRILLHNEFIFATMTRLFGGFQPNDPAGFPRSRFNPKPSAVNRMPKKSRNNSAIIEMGPEFVSASASPATGSWFYGSAMDLLIGCAAWSAPLLLLGYLFSSNYPNATSIAFYGLALVFNYPHYMATIYRAYRTKTDFQKYRLFTLHLTLLIGLLLILSHVSYQLLALLFTVYLTWSPFHYSGQNFGIALMFARRNGVTTTQKSRRMFYLAFLTSYLMFFLTIHSSPQGDPLILSLGIPLSVARVLWVGVFTTFLISVLYSLASFVKQTGWKKMSGPVVLLSTQVFWFVVPSAVTLFASVDFVNARSTAGLLAIMHSAQYLWITSYYDRREAAEGQSEKNNAAKQWRPFAYLALLVVGGIALFIPGPWIVSRVLRQDFTTSFLAFTALINIHHFMLDGAIWKLRDGRIASLLLGTTRVDSSGQTGNRVGGLVAFLTSQTTVARLARVGVAVALVILASFDQAKFYYGAQASDISSLRKAQQLNPYDASLLVRLARANERDGNSRESRAAIEAAVRVNPDYRPAQLAFGKALIDSSEYEQAYTHYKKMFERIQPDVDSLVNFGVLAAQLGKDDEAIDSWQKAIALDNNQTAAHLYLAEALIRKRKFADAIPQYETYLALAASESQSGQPSALSHLDVVLNAILKLAAAYQNNGSAQDAERVFSQAAKLAENSGYRDVMIFGLVHAAELKIKQSRLQDALTDYQRALTIENSVSDLAKASDWVRYGLLLRRLNAPSDLVTACFVKAEYTLGQKPDFKDDEMPDVKSVVEKEVKTAESADPAKVRSIRANLTTSVDTVLKLRL
jgi:tetratricopeptide (TPR) repeat protein